MSSLPAMLLVSCFLCPLDVRRSLRKPSIITGQREATVEARHRLRLFKAALLLEIFLVVFLRLVPGGFIERKHLGLNLLATTRLFVRKRLPRSSIHLWRGHKYCRHILWLARPAWVVIRPKICLTVPRTISSSDRILRARLPCCRPPHRRWSM